MSECVTELLCFLVLLSQKDAILIEDVREIHPVSVVNCFPCFCCSCTKRLPFNFLHVCISLLVGVSFALPSFLILFAFENFNLFSFCWLLLSSSDETLLSTIMNIITNTANVFISDILNLHAVDLLFERECVIHLVEYFWTVCCGLSLSLWPVPAKSDCFALTRLG